MTWWVTRRGEEAAAAWSRAAEAAASTVTTSSGWRYFVTASTPVGELVTRSRNGKKTRKTRALISIKAILQHVITSGASMHMSES